MYQYFEEKLKEKGLKVADVTRATGVKSTAFSEWKSGKAVPKYFPLKAVADFLGTTVDYLMTGVEAPRYIKIPVVGKIAAGLPSEAIEEIIDYEEIPEEWEKHGEFICLQVSGDSMLPRIESGDVVVLKRLEDMSEVNNGDIVAVFVNGNEEATLKKITIQSEGISLIPLNPAYETKYVKNGNYTIYGRVVELRAKFRL